MEIKITVVGEVADVSINPTNPTVGKVETGGTSDLLRSMAGGPVTSSDIWRHEPFISAIYEAAREANHDVLVSGGGLVDLSAAIPFAMKLVEKGLLSTVGKIDGDTGLDLKYTDADLHKQIIKSEMHGYDEGYKRGKSHSKPNLGLAINAEIEAELKARYAMGHTDQHYRTVDEPTKKDMGGNEVRLGGWKPWDLITLHDNNIGPGTYIDVMTGAGEIYSHQPRDNFGAVESSSHIQGWRLSMHNAMPGSLPAATMPGSGSGAGPVYTMAMRFTEDDMEQKSKEGYKAGYEDGCRDTTARYAGPDDRDRRMYHLSPDEFETMVALRNGNAYVVAAGKPAEDAGHAKPERSMTHRETQSTVRDAVRRFTSWASGKSAIAKVNLHLLGEQFLKEKGYRDDAPDGTQSVGEGH